MSSNHRGQATLSAGRIGAPIALAALLLLLPLASTATASLGLLSSFGESGQRAGQLNGAAAVAVNRSGAGGVEAGSVYVADNGNKRIDEFSPSGVFVRAFGWNTVAEGPDNVTPQNGEQKLKVGVSVTGGTYTLTFEGQTTSPIAFNASNSAVREALQALSTIGVGNVNVSGSSANGYAIVFQNALGNHPRPPIEVDSTNLVGGAATITVEVAGVEGGSAANAEQEVNIPASVSGGVFKLSFNGKSTGATATGNLTAGSNEAKEVSLASGAFTVGEQISGSKIPPGTTISALSSKFVGEEVRYTLNLSAPVEAGGTAAGVALTANLPYNASAEAVRNALTALSSIGHSGPTPNVEVTGGPGIAAPYTIVFVSNLADTSVPTIVANSSGLAGGSASVSVKAEGVSAYEVCDVQAHPADVCKSGEGVVQAGGLKGAGAITVDQETGAVYVGGMEDANNRIAVYSATGEFEGAFAWGVVNGSFEPQFCTTLCLAGVVGPNESRRETGGAGQLYSKAGGGVRGLTVAPIGSPHAGDLYVADAPNNRIDEFTPTISGGRVTSVAFERAFGWDVVESGPDNVPGVTEVQRIEIPGSVSGGKFTVSFEGQPTAELKYNATPAEVGTALRGVIEARYPFVGSGLEVSGGSGVYTITSSFGFLTNVNIPQLTVDSSGLVGGTASVQTLTQGVSPNEVCDVANHPSDVCKVGAFIPKGGAGSEEERGHEGQLTRPRDVGIDSAGDVYAVDGGAETGHCRLACRVEKFNADGSYAGLFSPANLSAVEEGESQAPKALGIDPADGNLLVVKQNSPNPTEFLALDGAGNLLESFPPSGVPATHFDFGTEERIYSASSSQVKVFGPAPAPSATLGPVTGITQTSATFSGTVTPPTGFATNYRFEYSLDGVTWSRAPEPDAQAGDGSGSGNPNNCPVENPPSCNVTETIGGLEPGTTYHVRLSASTGPSFTTPEAEFETAAPPLVAPEVSGAYAEAETSAATLTGYVNPHHHPAAYRFEWGPTSAYGHEAPVPEGSAGAGGKAVEVSAPITGLTPGTTYHFRLIATNEADETAATPDREFTTLDEAGLPDNRRPELVSPADKRPQGVVRPGATFGPFHTAEDGGSFAYTILNGLLDSTAGGEVQYLARRGETEWSSEQASAPVLAPSPADGIVVPSKTWYSSTDLSCRVTRTYSPLTADTPAEDVGLGVENLYRHNPDGGYTLLTGTVPSNPTKFNGYFIGGASPDCSRVYFQTGYDFLPHASGLYEWDEGTLRDAGILPDGTTASHAKIGGERPGVLSRDGRRFFFSAISDEGPDAGEPAVFMREDGVRTVDVSQTTTATAPQGARYEMASEDGSHIFFLADYGLTSSGSDGSSSGCGNSPTPEAAYFCDLYSYDTEAETLADLSADSNPADTAGPQIAGVFAASRDGAYVYFAAVGQLVLGQGNTYAQNQADGAANVYLSHEGQLSFVGLMTRSDLLKSVVTEYIRRSERSAQATPDGRFLLFDSSANVTSYDSGGALEAYFYSAESGETVCVSCRRDGEPSLNAGNSPIANVGVDQGERIVPRSLSDDGSRVFFTSRDPLAPGAGASEPNIYEWERGQVYLLNDGKDPGTKENLFLDSSASGVDVFLTSTEQLDPHDTDLVRDVYDLRVGGGFPSPTQPQAPCDPTHGQCQGTSTPLPSAAPPASSGFSGAGNPPVHKKHKHRKGHKHRKHKKPRHGRHAKSDGKGGRR